MSCHPDVRHLLRCNWQAEEVRQREKAKEVDERDRRSAELRAQLEADAATLRRAQKAVDMERAAQQVCTLAPVACFRCRTCLLHALAKRWLLYMA
jgi:hypothetical protein